MVTVWYQYSDVFWAASWHQTASNSRVIHSMMTCLSWKGFLHYWSLVRGNWSARPIVIVWSLYRFEILQLEFILGFTYGFLFLMIVRFYQNAILNSRTLHSILTIILKVLKAMVNTNLKAMTCCCYMSIDTSVLKQALLDSVQKCHDDLRSW